ncbi:MAG: hypothetical protein JWQ74_3024, partial [Marmoricola sp.]|nr:hypothetical protein [Marmoricola sp.]
VSEVMSQLIAQGSSIFDTVRTSLVPVEHTYGELGAAPTDQPLQADADADQRPDA